MCCLCREGPFEGVPVTAGDDVGEPVVQPAGRGVDGCVRAVDTDAFLGEAQERALLRVGEREGLEAAEDDGVCVCVRHES